MKKRYSFLPKNWLRFGLAVAFAASFSVNLQAQIAPAKQWEKTIGGSERDCLTSLRQTTDGGFILGGFSGSPISGDKSQGNFQFSADYWVVKTNANGNKVWDKTFGTIGSEELTSIIQTSDGGYLLGGFSNYGMGGDKSEPSRGYDDYWVIKVDGNGNKIWDRSFGGFGADYLQSIQQTSDGGYILGGMSTSGLGFDKTQPNFGSWDYWIVKLDASGNKLWDKSFGGSGWDRLQAIQQTSDGGYILGGHSDSPINAYKSQASKGSSDYWVIRLDAAGNKLWDKTLGGNWDEGLYTLQQTTDTGFILGGYSASGISGDKSQPNQGANDYWIVKLDSSGNKLWDKTLGGNGQELLTSICQTLDGGYIVGGSSSSGISGDKSEPSLGLIGDYWVVKINATGNKLWDKTLGGNKDEYLTSLRQTSDGGYLIGGESASDINGNKSTANKGRGDYWIVKLSAGISGIKESESAEVKLYPNPTNRIVNLEFPNPINAQVKVYNALGQCILTKTVSKQEKELNLDLANAAKGIYTIQVIAEKQSLIKKIVLE